LLFKQNHTVNYYMLPQSLNPEGKTNGHQHIVIQPLASTTTAPDPTKFTVFNAMEAKPDLNNDVAITVDNGLPAGAFRMCTFANSQSDLPVVMPGGKRGPHNDCIRVNVQNGGAAAAQGLTPNNALIGLSLIGSLNVGGAGNDPTQPLLANQSQLFNSQFCGLSQNLIKGAQCSNLVQGAIPNENQTVSSLIVNPPNGANVAANAPIPVQVSTLNLDSTGSIKGNTPQTLNAQGQVIGVQHLVVQPMQNNQSNAQPPDAAQVSAFQDLQNGQTTINKLAPGAYRMCTLTVGESDQPIIMPIAKRGHQDDCIQFTVGGKGPITPPVQINAANNAAANNSAAGAAGAAAAASGNNANDNAQGSVNGEDNNGHGARHGGNLGFFNAFAKRKRSVRQRSNHQHVRQ
jgi:hypothetical protein